MRCIKQDTEHSWLALTWRHVCVCLASTLQAGKETGVGRGHGDRPYDNFEKLEFDCEGQVGDVTLHHHEIMLGNMHVACIALNRVDRVDVHIRMLLDMCIEAHV